MLTFTQIEQMDKAIHDMAGAAQGILCVAHSIQCATPDEANRLRKATSEMVQRFSAAKAAYVAAKEGDVAGWDANGAAVDEVAQ